MGEFKSNDPSTHAAIVARQQELNRQVYSGLFLLAATVAILFIAPKYLTSPFDGMAMGFGSAGLLTAVLYLYPESLRSRRGSLVPARCLVAALWLLAAVTAVLSLVG